MKMAAPARTYPVHTYMRYGVQVATETEKTTYFTTVLPRIDRKDENNNSTAKIRNISKIEKNHTSKREERGK